MGCTSARARPRPSSTVHRLSIVPRRCWGCGRGAVRVSLLRQSSLQPARSMVPGHWQQWQAHTPTYVGHPPTHQGHPTGPQPQPWCLPQVLPPPSPPVANPTPEAPRRKKVGTASHHRPLHPSGWPSRTGTLSHSPCGTAREPYHGKVLQDRRRRPSIQCMVVPSRGCPPAMEFPKSSTTPHDPDFHPAAA